MSPRASSPSPQAGGPLAMIQVRHHALAASCLLAALLITLLAACDSTPDKRAGQEDWAAIGDRIQVTDCRHADSIEGDAYVDFDGTVSLPEIGCVSVAGHTASEIRTLLIERYGPYHDDLDLQVSITAGGPRYFVLGEVADPGPKPLTVGITVFQAVTASSPSPHSADLGRVRLIRRDSQIPRVLIILESSSDLDELIRDGDILHVPSIPDPEPEPAPEPRFIPGESLPILVSTEGGRA